MDDGFQSRPKYLGYTTPTGATFLRFGHDPSHNLIRIFESFYNIKYDNPENLSLISCTDSEKLLFKVSKVRLKAPKLGFQSKFI